MLMRRCYVCDSDTEIARLECQIRKLRAENGALKSEIVRLRADPELDGLYRMARLEHVWRCRSIHRERFKAIAARLGISVNRARQILLSSYRNGFAEIPWRLSDD